MSRSSTALQTPRSITSVIEQTRATPTHRPAVGTDFLMHFRLDRLLARGGMGEVYLGYDTQLERPVALKLVRPEFLQQPGFLDRFLREARAQAQVAHSNVVQVYFVGQAGDVAFMAMELVDGGDLSTHVEKHGPLPWRDALTHMLGIAEGLREAARLGILHRDIKPQNIMLDRNGVAHLADFGLAAPVTASARRDELALGDDVPTTTANLPKLTQFGMVMGTPAYMAPEQARGEELDHRADIYALGASFYELLSGRTPTEAATLQALTAFHEGAPPPKLRSLSLKVPAAFANVIDRCMAREKEGRFASFDELIDALIDAKPRPIITASSNVRVLAWAIDVAFFALVARSTLQLSPLISIAAFAVYWLGTALFTGSSPGHWMMRLSLRTLADERLAPAKLVMRFALQHGWLAFGALFIKSAYGAGGLSEIFAALSALSALVGVGGAFAAVGNPLRQTLVDRLTESRVRVDVR